MPLQDKNPNDRKSEDKDEEKAIVNDGFQQVAPRRRQHQQSAAADSSSRASKKARLQPPSPQQQQGPSHGRFSRLESTASDNHPPPPPPLPMNSRAQALKSSPRRASQQQPFNAPPNPPSASRAEAMLGPGHRRLPSANCFAKRAMTTATPTQRHVAPLQPPPPLYISLLPDDGFFGRDARDLKALEAAESNDALATTSARKAAESLPWNKDTDDYIKSLDPSIISPSDACLFKLWEKLQEECGEFFHLMDNAIPQDTLTQDKYNELILSLITVDKDRIRARKETIKAKAILTLMCLRADANEKFAVPTNQHFTAFIVALRVRPEELEFIASMVENMHSSKLQPDTCLYNAYIVNCAKSGRKDGGSLAEKMYRNMGKVGLVPDKITKSSLITAITSNDPSWGKTVLFEFVDEHFQGKSTIEPGKDFLIGMTALEDVALAIEFVEDWVDLVKTIDLSAKPNPGTYDKILQCIEKSSHPDAGKHAQACLDLMQKCTKDGYFTDKPTATKLNFELLAYIKMGDYKGGSMWLLKSCHNLWAGDGVKPSFNAFNKIVTGVCGLYWKEAKETAGRLARAMWHLRTQTGKSLYTPDEVNHVSAVFIAQACYNDLERAERFVTEMLDSHDLDSWCVPPSSSLFRTVIDNWENCYPRKYDQADRFARMMWRLRNVQTGQSLFSFEEVNEVSAFVIAHHRGPLQAAGFLEAMLENHRNESWCVPPAEVLFKQVINAWEESEAPDRMVRIEALENQRHSLYSYPGRN